MKREIDEELRFHLEQRTTDNIAAGMAPEEAAREARKRFGNWQSVREDCRAVLGASLGEATLRDSRFGLRMLRRSPGFTTAAILTLALCIGANLAIFAVVDAILVRPLPFRDAGRLVTVFNSYPYRYHALDVFSVFIVTRTSLPPESFGSTLQTIVRRIEPALPVNDLQTMETRIADTLIMRRSPLLLAGVFAGVALLLAAIGTYGVLSYAVAQRRREIGVRMALGALPGQIGRQFLSLGLRLLLVGTILGMLGAWIAGRAMQSLLFNVPPLHLATFVGTALIMGVVSSVACWLPARRASHVDPMEALRHE